MIGQLEIGKPAADDEISAHDGTLRLKSIARGYQRKLRRPEMNVPSPTSKRFSFRSE
jgi:hypothetical protein